ncbi:hypothetical protein MHBO_004497 [Bonamia ostreae]
MVRGFRLLFLSLRAFEPSEKMVTVLLGHIAATVNIASLKDAQWNFATSFIAANIQRRQRCDKLLRPDGKLQERQIGSAERRGDCCDNGNNPPL